jgi:hypothetical protein
MQSCFDTSALLECWSRYYPIDVFPGIWERLHWMIEAGDLFAPDEVHEETKKKDDDLAAWVKDRSQMFVPLGSNVQAGTTEILAEFLELVKALSGRNQADPFVIALARVRAATVVTQERGGNRARPRIPLVCEHFGVACIDVVGFIRERGWVFS